MDKASMETAESHSCPKKWSGALLSAVAKAATMMYAGRILTGEAAPRSRSPRTAARRGLLLRRSLPRIYRAISLEARNLLQLGMPALSIPQLIRPRLNKRLAGHHGVSNTFPAAPFSANTWACRISASVNRLAIGMANSPLAISWASCSSRSGSGTDHTSLT